MLWTAPDVPVTIPLREVGVAGIAGAAEECRSVAMWMRRPGRRAAQPVRRDRGAARRRRTPSRDWDWVKWLPHAAPTTGTRVAVGAIEEPTTRRPLGARSRELLGERRARPRRGGLDEQQVAGCPAAVVVLDGARRIRMSPGMVSLLKDGPAVGLYFVCLDRTVRELPEECRPWSRRRRRQLNLR